MFNIGILKETKNFEVNVKVENKLLFFDVTGSLDDDKYSIFFSTEITVDELKKLEEAKKYDMLTMVDPYDIAIGKNGIVNLEPVNKMTICRYIKNKFIIYIEFFVDNWDKEAYFATLEFEFNLDDL